MGRIQSSVGLITGIPIEETVGQLLSISAQPRDRLVARNEGLQAERIALTELTALVIGVQFSIDNLGSSNIFEEKQISSSNEELLTVTATGAPSRGTYEFTPVRQAQTHQLLSDAFAANDDPLGEGEVTLRFGGFVDKGISVDELNSGEGIQHGKIRITDRSGASAEIDLRFAQTIDDVVKAINDNNEIDVTAGVNGDRLTLADKSGQTVSNLRVREVGGGTTAADLGLADIDVAANEAIGTDILSLHEDLQLSQLNDGNGVYLRAGVADLEVTFSDGSAPLRIEFLAEIKGETTSAATIEAQNGIDAQFTITSLGTGQDWDDYDITFEDNEEVTIGNETVEVDTVRKEIKFQIDAAGTRAVHLVSALNNDEAAKELFVAEIAAEGDGTGVIDTSDSGTTRGGAIEYAQEETLGDILETINAADPTRLRAEINAAGDGIDLIDLTFDPNAPQPSGPNLWNVGQPIPSGSTGNGTTAVGPNLWNTGQPIPNATTIRGFSVRSFPGGSAAEDLGISIAASSGVISGRRRLSGLDTVLLDSLSGGSGLGELGSILISDRSGATAEVNLSNAETLEQVISSINTAAREAGAGITAAVNSARNGIELVDTSSGTGNLSISNGDATNTADALQLSIDAAVNSVNSKSLDLQTFNEQLSLDTLNNGRGIGRGSFLITDSNGNVGAVNTTVIDAQTVGDIISEINRLSIDVRASINETGDGLQLVDIGGGTGNLSVNDVGTGTVAAALKIDGAAVSAQINGVTEKVIDGATTVRIQLDSDDTLSDLVEKINEADADVAASVFNRGSGSKPFRLSLVSQVTGSAGELLIDGSSLGIPFEELVSAKDALLMLGSAEAPIATALARSSSNDFESVIDGVSLTIAGTAQESVTINIEDTEEPLVSQLNLFTDQYNNLRDKLDELTFFDEVENTTGVLFGRAEALRIEFDLARVITGRFFGAGSIQSLEEVGIGLNSSGRATFDEKKFRSKYADEPEAVEQFFTTEEAGVSAKFVKLAEQLAGQDNSVLINRSQTLQQTMELNSARIISLTNALEQERESLLEEFFRLETAIGQMQSSLTALNQIQPVQPLVSLGPRG